VSPNTSFPLHESPQNTITQLILDHPRVTFHVDRDVLVIAIKDELLVRKASRIDSPRLNEALLKVASNAGSLGRRPASGRGEDDADEESDTFEPPPEPSAADEVEIWRLINPDDNSIDQARRLRILAQEECCRTRSGPSSVVPPVSPNHVCVVSEFDCCPATPPIPVPPIPTPPPFVEAPDDAPMASVVVIDTGYIETYPFNAALDARVTVVPGEWYDTAASQWRTCPPDFVDTDPEGRLIGVVGHGTFIAGIVAHQSRQAQVTVVGQRYDCMPLTPNLVDKQRLFATEYDIASALLNHADADVVSCGFAFPTLDGYASIAFTSVMQVLTGPDAPRPGVAVVAPAGNERTTHPYWPAAHPDVVGVAATNPLGGARAWFSNWGPWVNCCARGQDVRSTFVDWVGPIQGEPLSDVYNFSGWAIWNGTSFSTPKVSGAIARAVAENGITGVDAYELLISGGGGVAVTPLTDMTLTPFPGVTLPHLHLD